MCRRAEDEHNLETRCHKSWLIVLSADTLLVNGLDDCLTRAIDLLTSEYRDIFYTMLGSSFWCLTHFRNPSTQLHTGTLDTYNPTLIHVDAGMIDIGKAVDMSFTTNIRVQHPNQVQVTEYTTIAEHVMLLLVGDATQTAC